MSLLGRLLHNRRAGEIHMAWNRPNFQGSELLALSSPDFGDNDVMPRTTTAKYVGGDNRSPSLSWSPPPAGTAQLLLVVEDVDVPMSKPAVHCVALIDPATEQLEPGALAAKRPGRGVRLMRSAIGRGYHGPAPIKGHGPHRYVFQLFALGDPVAGDSDAKQHRARPGDLMAAVTAPVLGRGRLTGVFER